MHADVLLKRGHRLDAACNYINAATCLERKEMLDKAEEFIDRAFQTLFGDHSLHDDLFIDNWFNEYIIELSKDDPKNLSQFWGIKIK